MSGPRGTRARSVSLAFANFPKQVSHRRSHSSLLGSITRSVRVVVLGLGGVGKTAMAVRFVTKRFIGDYDPTLESIYRHTTTIDDQLVHYEIMDTAGQENNCLEIEDKCKWGESFIFVYDVTDKYSFNELTRLKFIASYTHAKMKVNFKPCWILVGNKRDLAEHDRMVSPEEGMALARQLGCHLFREISVKESINDASEVFEDLWREFSRLSPRSPSTSQRRKFSVRIQDKISVLDSEACTCASEVLRESSSESTMSSLAIALKRQGSVTSLYSSSTRSSKDMTFSDQNNNDERIVPKIPEHRDAVENPDPRRRSSRSQKKLSIRKNFESKFSPFPSFPQQDILPNSISVDNVYSTSSSSPIVGGRSPLNFSSRSSSNSSLNELSSPNDTKVKVKLFERTSSKVESDNLNPRSSDSPGSDDLVSQYQNHCRRHKGRRCDFSRLNSSSVFTPSPSFQIGSY